MATTKRGGPTKAKAKAKAQRSRSGSRTREGDRSSSAAPAAATVKPIGSDEIAKVSPRPLDAGSLPGFTVTVTGSLPKVFTSIVLRKGPIEATSKEAAIATFMAEVGTQLKKTDLFHVQSCVAEETAKPVAPQLPFQNGQPAKTDTAPTNGSVAKAPAPAAAAGGSRLGAATTTPPPASEPAKKT